MFNLISAVLISLVCFSMAMWQVEASRSGSAKGIVSFLTLIQLVNTALGGCLILMGGPSSIADVALLSALGCAALSALLITLDQPSKN